MFRKFRWVIAQATELWWWKSYLKNKNPNSYKDWKIAYWKKLLEHLNLSNINTSNHSILDIGCGPAGIFMVFNQAVVTAVDPLILKYEEKLPHFRRTDYPNVTFEEGKLENYCSKLKFDYVFCINAINHVQNLPKSIKNLSLLLVDNGQLIISIDAHNNNWLKKLFQIIPGDILHPHQYNLKEYIQFLKENGFFIHKTIAYKTGYIFNYYVLVASKKSS